MSDPHLLRAISEALSDPFEFLRVIVESADRDAAVLALQDHYDWDELQAQVVMDMQFRRATRVDRDLIMDEYQRTKV